MVFWYVLSNQAPRIRPYLGAHIHTQGDDLVPPTHSEQLHAECKNNSEICIFEGDHNRYARKPRQPYA
jgi:hypothetical protein